MGEVEADVHDAHGDALSLKGLRQVETVVDSGGIDDNGHRVEQRLTDGTRLDADDTRVERQGTQTVDRDADDMDVGNGTQGAAAIVGEHALDIATETYQRTDLTGRCRRLGAGARRHGRARRERRCRRLAHQLAEHRRQLLPGGLLGG